MVLRGVGLVAVLVASLLALGCEDPEGGGSNPGTAPGAPMDGGGDNEAAGSPGRVPKIGKEGFLLGEPHNVRAEIEEAFRQECGGELCVDLVERPSTDPSKADSTVCEYLGLDPEGGSQFEPGDTIVILTGPREPCDGEATEDPQETVEPGEEVSPEVTG